MALAVTAAVAIAVPPAQNDQHPRPPAQPEPGQPSRRLLTLAAAVGSATVLGALPAFAATPAPERPAAAPPRAPGAGHRDVVPDARLRRLDEFVVDLSRRDGKVREARIRSVGGRSTEVSWKGVTRRVELRPGGFVTLRKF